MTKAGACRWPKGPYSTRARALADTLYAQVDSRPLTADGLDRKAELTR